MGQFGFFDADAAPHLPSRYDELISECSVLCVMADAMPEHVGIGGDPDPQSLHPGVARRL